jgi:hypothetical protein
LRRAEGGNKRVSFETRHHEEKKRSNAHLQNESVGYREKLYLGHPKFGCQYSRPAAFDQQTVEPTRPSPADKRHHVTEKLTTPDVRKSSQMFRRPSEPFTQKPADTGKLPRTTPALTLPPKDLEKNSSRASNESVKRIEVSPSSEPVLTSHSNDVVSKSTLVTPPACDVELSWECGAAALQPEVLSPLLQGGTAGVYPPSWQREGNFRTSPPLLGLQGSSNLGSLHPHDRNFASSVQNSTPTKGGVTKVVSDMDNVRCKDCRGCFCVELFYEKERALPEKPDDREKKLIDRVDVLERVNSQLESDVASLRVGLESLRSSLSSSLGSSLSSCLSSGLSSSLGSSLGSSLSSSLGSSLSSSLGSSLGNSLSSSLESSSEKEVAEVRRRKRRRRIRRKAGRHTDTTTCSKGVQTEEEYIPALPLEVPESVSCRPEEQPLAGPWVSQGVAHQSAVSPVPALENEFVLDPVSVCGNAVAADENIPALLLEVAESVSCRPEEQPLAGPGGSQELAHQSAVPSVPALANDELVLDGVIVCGNAGSAEVIVSPVLPALQVALSLDLDESEFTMDFAQHEEFQKTDTTNGCDSVHAPKSGLVTVCCFWLKVATLIICLIGIAVAPLVAIADAVAGRPRSRASKRSGVHQLRHLRLESELDRAMVPVPGRCAIDLSC